MTNPLGKTVTGDKNPPHPAMEVASGQVRPLRGGEQRRVPVRGQVTEPLQYRNQEGRHGDSTVTAICLGAGLPSEADRPASGQRGGAAQVGDVPVDGEPPLSLGVRGERPDVAAEQFADAQPGRPGRHENRVKGLSILVPRGRASS